MGTAMSDTADLIFQVAKANVEATQVAFKSGYDAGFKQGFKEGSEWAIQKAVDVVNNSVGKVAS